MTDDCIVPARTMRPVNKTDVARAMKDDLVGLGLRVAAGQQRSRGGHDLRAWFKTRTIEDGADSLLIRRVTHAPPRDVESGTSGSAGLLCREVSKLRISAESRGQVLELATGLATAEKWRVGAGEGGDPTGNTSVVHTSEGRDSLRFAA